MPDREPAVTAEPPDQMAVQVSSRDPQALRSRLEGWLAGRLPEGSAPTVPEVASTSTNGMSSDTVLFSARWQEQGVARVEGLVARIAPDPADVPVFPNYDLARQYETLRLVAELTSVPVPRVWWFEPDEEIVGAPFFVMTRVEGEVPPDVMPYTFGDNWLFDAPPDQQRHLQEATVALLAELHAIDEATSRFSFLELDVDGATPLRRHLANTRAWYEFAHDGNRSPLIERGLAWLDEHLPDPEGPPVLSWGDARIGNILYRDFEPVAVLDWEMAGLGPRELDLGWLVNAHLVFETLAASFELPGMPGFLRVDEVASHYESLTGYTPRHLDWFLAYASVQWAIVFLRTGLRAVHFGEREMPGEIDELHHHRPLLEEMLSKPPRR
jgi:aminoglycoside phosphotransferase (APT) family kinase protein